VQCYMFQLKKVETITIEAETSKFVMFAEDDGLFKVPMDQMTGRMKISGDEKTAMSAAGSDSSVPRQARLFRRVCA